MAKYRLENQPEEYELVTSYTEWIPYGFDDWNDFIEFYTDEDLSLSIKSPHSVLVMNSEGTDARTLLLDKLISKAVFPLDAYPELKDWHLFWITATEQNPDTKFVIPAH